MTCCIGNSLLNYSFFNVCFYAFNYVLWFEIPLFFSFLSIFLPSSILQIFFSFFFTWTSHFLSRIKILIFWRLYLICIWFKKIYCLIWKMFLKCRCLLFCCQWFLFFFFWKWSGMCFIRTRYDLIHNCIFEQTF